jgi:hypothetical protein
VINSHIFWPDEERSSIILSHSQQADLNRRLLIKTTDLFKKMIEHLTNSASSYEGLEYLCDLDCLIPRDIDQNWYLNSILLKQIDTVSKLKIIKTANNGAKVSILEAILPEWDINLDSEKTILGDLIELLEPIFGKSGRLIGGDLEYIGTWVACVS